MLLIVIRATHPEYLLNSQDAFHEDGSQLVSNARQQKAKERDAKYGIKNAKDFPALCSRSYVSITCRNNKNTRMKKGDWGSVKMWYEGQKHTQSQEVWWGGRASGVLRVRWEAEEDNQDPLMQHNQLKSLHNSSCSWSLQYISSKSNSN